MEIRKFNSEGLKSFINSDEYKNLNVIPITKHRALSHINNPRLDKEDNILYLAFIANELVGYRVVMPDNFYFGQEIHKIGWYSCVWVDPNKRGSGIAKALVNESIKDWKGKIVLVDPVPASKALYLQTGKFTDKIKVIGFRGYSRFNLSEILTNKKPGLTPFKGFFKILDASINLPNKFRLLFWQSKNDVSKLKFEYISEVDTETELFIQRYNQNEISQKNHRDINWFIKYPWVLMTPNKDSVMQKYYFSSQSKEYITLAIKLYTDNILSTFMIISIRDGHLKIPYLLTSENTNYKNLTNLLYFHLLKWNVSTFTTFNKLLIENINKRSSPFIFTKRVRRQYLFSKLFEEYILSSNPNIQDGEGDAAFV